MKRNLLVCHARSVGWDLRHRRIRKGDYWVQANRSAHYNRYRNKAAGGATAGCVSAPRWFLQALMNRLERSAEPVIAIGR